MAADTLEGHKIGCARTDPVSAQGDDFGHIMGGSDPSAGYHRNLVPNPLLLKEAVYLGDRVFNRHGNVLLGNIRGRPCSAIASIQVDDMGSRIIAAHRHHIHIGWCRHFDRNQRLRVYGFDPVYMLFVILHGIDAVKRER